MPSDDLLSLLYEAQAADLGLVVSVSDFPRARAALYKARSDSGDESLNELSLRQPPGKSDEIWILNSKAKESLRAKKG